MPICGDGDVTARIAWLALACCVLPGPAAVAQVKPGRPDVPAAAPDKPITDQPVTAGDVVTTPISDLNLRKQEIPALLIAAQSRPYDLAGLKKCRPLAAEIAEFDKVLGADIDLPQGDGPKPTAGKVAKAAVASFIPFRGLIREISGANAQNRKLQDAIEAGIARRAFLKGYGEARGCRYPARSATPAAMAAAGAANALADAPQKPVTAKRARRGKTRFVSQPVVQKID